MKLQNDQNVQNSDRLRPERLPKLSKYVYRKRLQTRKTFNSSVGKYSGKRNEIAELGKLCDKVGTKW